VDPTSFPAFTEFDTRRAVVLLTKDAPTLDVRVGFYTQVLGTKRGQQVKVNSVTAPSNHVGGSTHTFMRSAERLHVAKSSVWSTSQGCALRNCKFDGDLKLSASTQDWGSGGFLSDLFVTGTLDTGIQQQHIVKASKIGALKASPSSWNLLFVGVDGVPKPTAAEERYIEIAGEVAEGTQQKPYLEQYFGTWEIIVPKAKTQLSGFESAPETEKINVHKECEVWSVASNSSKGNAPKSTHSKCVIIAPGVYTIDTPIIFDSDDAVILGLGFATFECTTHEQCVTIKGDRVSVSGLVLDAGYTTITKPTQPLFNVHGNDARLFDIFARVIATKSSLVRADVMVHIKGHGAILDNTWLWHADHDPWSRPFEACQVAMTYLEGSLPYLTANSSSRDAMMKRVCSTGGWTNDNDGVSGLPYRTDACVSHHALLVDGDHFLVYGLLAEHTHDDVVVWNGEHGTTYLLQCEVPYYQMGAGTWNASKVAYRVNARSHTAYALGGYVTNPGWVGTYTPFTQKNMFHFAANAELHKVFAWINPPGSNTYVNVFNTTQNFALSLDSCDSQGGLKQQTACYWNKPLPPAPPLAPLPPPTPPSPPNPPNPPPSPPTPPHSPPPVDTFCVIEDANGGDLGTKAAQSTEQVHSVEQCADFCRGVHADSWFLMYSTPGYCFCYLNAGRTFPGKCYPQPGGVVGTVNPTCGPATTKCSPPSMLP
jgi:hypothetical protein